MALVASELVARIRLLAYNPTQDMISDNTILQIIESWIDIFGDDDKNKCKVLWNSLISVLEYLWNTDLIKQGTEVGSMAGRTEKVGEVQVSVTYTPNTYYTSPWEDIYKSYLNGDFKIPGCSGVNGASDKVLVGGVNACEIERVNSNPVSVNGLGSVASVDRRSKNTDWNRRRNPFYPFGRP